jgi:type II secretory pathway pseudopilin PulG
MKQDSERGTTLVEVLIAVLIIGTAFVALLSALSLSLYSSGTHRKQANAEVTMRTAAEQADDATYLKCGSSYSITNVTVVVTPLHQNGSNFSGCTSATDEGLEKLTLSIPSQNQTLDVIKRAP